MEQLIPNAAVHHSHYFPLISVVMVVETRKKLLSKHIYDRNIIHSKNNQSMKEYEGNKTRIKTRNFKKYFVKVAHKHSEFKVLNCTEYCIF